MNSPAAKLPAEDPFAWKSGDEPTPAVPPRPPRPTADDLPTGEMWTEAGPGASGPDVQTPSRQLPVGDPGTGQAYRRPVQQLDLASPYSEGQMRSGLISPDYQQQPETPTGLTFPKATQGSEELETVVPGQGTAGAAGNQFRQGVETGLASGIAGAARVADRVGSLLTANQMATISTIDAGGNVPDDQDPAGYQYMSPDQRAQFKAGLGAAAASPDKAGSVADRIVQRARSDAERNAPVDVSHKDEAVVKLAGMAGGMAPLLVGTAIGGLPGAVGVGFLQGYEGMFERATEKGASPQQAHDAALVSGVVGGGLMTVPAGLWFGKLVPGLQIPVLGAVIDHAIGGGAMVGIMQMQTLADNAIVKYGFSPSQSLTENVGDPNEMALQGVLGVGLHGLPRVTEGMRRAGETLRELPSMIRSGRELNDPSYRAALDALHDAVAETPGQAHWADLNANKADMDRYWPDRSNQPLQLTGPEAAPRGASPEPAPVDPSMASTQTVMDRIRTERDQAVRTQPTTAQGEMPPPDVQPQTPAPVESTPPALAPPPAPRPPLETPPVIAMPGPRPPVESTPVKSQPVQPIQPVESLPAAGQPSPAPTPTGTYVMLRPDQLGVDPKRFQFKESNEQGVTGALAGTNVWEPDLATPIMAWQDNNGQFWVADGHQRHDLATRAIAAGQQNVEIPARVYREADGYTPEFMRVLAAYRNISEGSGTPIDAAKIIRETASVPPERRLPGLPPRGQMVEQGTALARLSPEAFGIVVNGVVPPAYAAHVGSMITDPAQQVAALTVLARVEPNNSEQARSIVKDIVASGYTREIEGGQTEMEGMGPGISSLFLERARILDRAKSLLRGNKRVFGAAVRGEEALTGAGNQLDREGNVRAKTENEQLLDILERSASSRGPISEALTVLAQELANGKPVPGLVSQFLTQVRGIVRRGEGEGIRPGDPAVRPGEAGEGPEGPVEGQDALLAGTPLPLYSAVDRAVGDLKQAKGTGEQMLSQIMKTPGVKPEEVKWMNLAAWLKDQKSVTREQIQDYVKAHQLEVHEIQHGDNSTQYSTWRQKGGQNYRELLITLPRRAEEDYQSQHWDDPNVVAHLRMEDRTGPNGERVLNVVEAQSDWHQAGRKEGYTAPPTDEEEAHVAELRRQIAAPQPRIPESSEAEWLQRFEDYTQKQRGISYDELGAHGKDDVRHEVQAKWLADIHPPMIEAWTRRREALRNELSDILIKREQGVPEAPFKTSWPALVMKRAIKFAVDNGYDMMTWERGPVHADRYDLSRQINRVAYQDASAMGIGRADMDAPNGRGQVIAHDHDGRQVLSKWVDNPEKELPNIVGKDLAEKLLNAPKAEINGGGGWRTRSRSLQGLDLKVGGEGMGGFYDKILPTETQKIVGKYGTKVGTTEMSVPYKDRDKVKPDAQAIRDHGAEWERTVAAIHQAEVGRGREYPPEAQRLHDHLGVLHEKMVDETMARGETQQFHTVMITPALRAAIQEQGLPLFAGKRLGREPTIRNDPNQVIMPGMGPSTIQAQAARDQANGGRGTLSAKVPQKPADEGLFAPVDRTPSLFDQPTAPRPASAPPPAPPPAPPVSKWAAEEGRDFVDELHTIPNLDGGHAMAADWVFTRGRETGFEHVAVVENATGRIVHAGTSQEPDSVLFTRSNTYGSPDAYTFHHNHPNETSISGGDLKMLTSPGITHIVAHTPNGHTFTASLPDPTVRSEDRYMANGLGNTLARQHEAFRQAVIPIFQRLARDGKITAAEVQSAYGDAANRLLHQAGVINYTSTYETPAATRAALKASGHELHDRSAVAVSPAQRTAGLPAPDGSVAQTAPAGGNSGAGRSPVKPGTSDQGRLFSSREVDDAFGLEAGKPLKDLVKWVNDQPSYQEKRDALTEFIAPMRLGPKETTNEAFKFANQIRQGQRRFGQIAQTIRDKFPIKERWEIGRAHAEQSVFERKLARDLAAMPPAQQPAYEATMRARFDATGAGHAGLSPKAQALVKGLSAIQEQFWDEMKAREMVDKNAEGWAYWMPRQLVIMENGKARRIIKDDSLIPGSGKTPFGRTPTPDIHPFGTNLTTEIPGFRNHEEVQATLDAARAKYGPNVQLVDDIMGLVGGLERINAAIAGHDLIQSIVDYGNRIGAPTALLGGARPQGFFMAGHPSMYKVVPKFIQSGGETIIATRPDGSPIFEKQAIWIDNAFKPALDAVFRAPLGGLAKAFMALKALSTHFVMQSPLIHLQVELGRALPLVAGRQLVVGMMGAGRRARIANDPRIDLLVQHGMAPIVKGFIGDPVSLMNEANYRSPFGAVGDAISDFRNALANFAGKSPRGGEAMAALIRHPIQTLLWNRVMDLQIAIGLGFSEDRLAAGWHPTAAYTAAAHLANRYAGALPAEGMSRLANTLANVFLFSRSFTGGNIGVMKDTVTGAPKHVLSHIGIDAGPKAEAEAKAWMKSKARRTFFYDILLFYGIATMIQHASQLAFGSGDEEDIVKGYKRRFHEAANYVTEHPIKSIIFPPGVFAKLLPMADNEPGKDRRSRVMPLAGTPQWVYMRTPAGKVGEEFLDWLTDAPETLARKQSTIVKGAYEAFVSGKDSFGHDITRPSADWEAMNGWRRIKHFLGAVLPIELEKDIYKAMGSPGAGGAPATRKERILSGARAGLSLSGLGSLSRGYPYGPVAGSQKQREGEIKFDTAELMPEVQRLVVAGKPDEAIELLTKAGEDPSRANKIVAWFDPAAGSYAADKATQLGEKRASHRGDEGTLDRNEVIRRSYGLTPKAATEELETTH